MGQGEMDKSKCIYVCEDCIRKAGIVAYILHRNKKCMECSEIKGCAPIEPDRYKKKKEKNG
jgi:hypothetical protein